jgi:hypothetical protein
MPVTARTLNLPTSKHRVLSPDNIQSLNKILGMGYTVRFDPGIGQEPACVVILERTVLSSKALVVEGRSETMDRAFHRALLAFEARLQDGYRGRP